MARILVNAAIKKASADIRAALRNVNYIMKRNWIAYQSHRKTKMVKINGYIPSFMM